MRRLSLFMVLGILAIAATAFAAPAKPYEAWASGQLERVDTTAKSVIVKQGMHEMTFVLGSAVQLTEGKKALQKAELPQAVGHHVKVRYTITDGAKVADRIDVSDTPRMSAPPAHKG